jgi:hypothetical protein
VWKRLAFLIVLIVLLLPLAKDLRDSDTVKPVKRRLGILLTERRRPARGIFPDPPIALMRRTTEPIERTNHTESAAYRANTPPSGTQTGAPKKKPGYSTRA